jgi:hypothetical protein
VVAVGRRLGSRLVEVVAVLHPLAAKC